MNAILGSQPVTISSREIADLTGKRHDQVLRTARELMAQGVTQSVETLYVHDQNGQQYPEHRLNKRDSLVLVARLSPEFTARIVDRWMQLEASIAYARPLTTTETLIQMLQLQAEVERRQAEQALAITAIDARIERVEVAQTVLSARPANSESIVHIRKRIWRLYGLSDATIDAVMRQSPYAPKPAGMVRNDRAEADGATYAVYWTKDVTKAFERFISECKPVSPAFYTHPFVEGRFKMVLKH